MATDKKLAAQEAFDVADSMQAAAAVVLTFRRANKSTLSDQEYDALVENETALRYDADRYRAVGITLMASTSKVTAQNLIAAIDSATIAIEKITHIKQLLEILNELVTLGVTIASGNVQSITKQVTALQATVRTNT